MAKIIATLISKYVVLRSSDTTQPRVATASHLGAVKGRLSVMHLPTVVLENSVPIKALLYPTCLTCEVS